MPSRDDTRHDDPLSKGSVLSVRHHHPWFSPLRHRTKVQMEEGLALQEICLYTIKHSLIS